VAIVFLSCNCSWISCHPGLGVAEVVDLDELEDDPFLDNPRYKYSFNVADDEEQTYQRQVQQMEDRVRIPMYLGVSHDIIVWYSVKTLHRGEAGDKSLPIVFL
jgi:hypothetical protein